MTSARLKNLLACSAENLTYFSAILVHPGRFTFTQYIDGYVIIVKASEIQNVISLVCFSVVKVIEAQKIVF